MNFLTGESEQLYGEYFDTLRNTVGATVYQEPGDKAYVFSDTEVVEEDGVYYTEIPYDVVEDNYSTYTSKALRIRHPDELPGIQDYVDHLLMNPNREPIEGTPYFRRRIISRVKFKDPDRNGDGQIDVADLIQRINELAAEAATPGSSDGAAFEAGGAGR